MEKRLIVGLAALAGLALACGGGGGGTPSPARPTEQSTTKAAPAGGLSDGTYKVGEDIKVGSYKTVGHGEKGDPLGGCYWARLKSDDPSDIIANNNVPAGAPGRMTVAKTDKFIMLTGGCTWTPAK